MISFPPWRAFWLSHPSASDHYWSGVSVRFDRQWKIRATFSTVVRLDRPHYQKFFGPVGSFIVFLAVKVCIKLSQIERTKKQAQIDVIWLVDFRCQWNRSPFQGLSLRALIGSSSFFGAINLKQSVIIVWYSALSTPLAQGSPFWCLILREQKSEPLECVECGGLNCYTN